MRELNNSHAVLLILAVMTGCATRHGTTGGAGIDLVLADGQARESVTSWTPESADLLFTSNREGNSEIYLLHGGSGELENLTNDPGPDNWPVWSPDGQRIAFQSRRTGNLDIWVMNTDGSGLTQLTDDPEHDYLPAWSPDGTRISFASWRREEADADAERTNHIYMMNADGSDQHRFLAQSPNTSAGLIWSPVGSQLALTRKLEGGSGDVFLLDGAGEVTGRLTEDEAYDGGGQFSPDGSHLAFYSEEGGNSEIVVMAVDGSDRRSVVEDGQAWYPRWSPDGRWIVYTVATSDAPDLNLDLFAVRADGSGEPIPLVTGPGRDSEGSWRPAQ
ncbi:MAG: PD40 domain-containing protein [Acidobacteria bacterium]|nr:PD40 domain-containing protein [Acidobacteriota bacterium]